MEKGSDQYLLFCPLDELEEYGFLYIRNQPCKIQTIDMMRTKDKYKKKKDDDIPERVRAQVKAHNAWTDEEVFDGTVTDDPVKVPKIDWEVYEAIFIDPKTSECRLMLEDSEDFEEIDDIKLPVEEKPKLVELLRKDFSEANEVNDRILVKVICMFGRKQIWEYSRERTDVSD